MKDRWADMDSVLDWGFKRYVMFCMKAYSQNNLAALTLKRMYAALFI